MNHRTSLKLANNKGDTPISVSPAVAALARRLGQKDLPNNNLSPTNLNTGAPQPRRSVTATHQSPKKPGGRRFSKAEPHIMNLMGRSERVLHYREAQEHTPALRPNTSIYPTQGNAVGLREKILESGEEREKREPDKEVRKSSTSHNIVKYSMQHIENQFKSNSRGVNNRSTSISMKNGDKEGEKKKRLGYVARPLSIADIFGNIVKQIGSEATHFLGEGEEEIPQQLRRKSNPQNIHPGGEGLEPTTSPKVTVTALSGPEVNVNSERALLHDDIEIGEKISTGGTEHIDGEERPEIHSGSENNIPNMLSTTAMTNKDIKENKIFHDNLQEKANQRKSGRLRKSLKINYILILPDDPHKLKWDVVILILLLYSATVIPFRTAFVEKDELGWIIADCIVDFLFFIDMLCQFVSAYFNSNEELIVDRKQIALHYLKTWFIIDSVSIIPFNFIFSGSRNYSKLARIARLPRLYRLLRMTKLARTARLVTEKNSLSRQFDKMVRLSIGAERLFYFMAVFLILCHITACIWYLISVLDYNPPDTWVMRYGYQDKNNYDTYVAALYWTISTITTVGYGDIVPGTTNERWFALIIMCVGVISYSYAISSLSSVLHSLDSQQAKLKEKLVTLDEYDVQYNLATELYMRLRQSIKFNNRLRLHHNLEFMKDLPQKLQLELSSIIHKQIVSKFPFFQAQSAEFIAHIGPLLRPRKIQKEDYVYREGDGIDEIYFLLQGTVELVIHEYDDVPYVIIPQGYYFGELDLIQMLIDENQDGTRHFTVKAREDCDVLVLSKGDLFKVMDKFEREINMIFLAGEKRLSRTIQQKERVIESIRVGEGMSEKLLPPKLSITPMGGRMGVVANMGQIDESEESSFCTDESSEISETGGDEPTDHQHSNSAASFSFDEDGDFDEEEVQSHKSRRSKGSSRHSRSSKHSGTMSNRGARTRKHWFNGRENSKKVVGGKKRTLDQEIPNSSNLLSHRFKKMNTLMRDIENKQVKLSGLLGRINSGKKGTENPNPPRNRKSLTFGHKSPNLNMEESKKKCPGTTKARYSHVQGDNRDIDSFPTICEPEKNIIEEEVKQPIIGEFDLSVIPSEQEDEKDEKREVEVEVEKGNIVQFYVNEDYTQNDKKDKSISSFD